MPKFKFKAFEYATGADVCSMTINQKIDNKINIKSIGPGGSEVLKNKVNSSVRNYNVLLVQWQPLNVITLGRNLSDNVNRMITISDLLPIGRN